MKDKQQTTTKREKKDEKQQKNEKNHSTKCQPLLTQQNKK